MICQPIKSKYVIAKGGEVWVVAAGRRVCTGDMQKMCAATRVYDQEIIWESGRFNIHISTCHGWIKPCSKYTGSGIPPTSV